MKVIIKKAILLITLILVHWQTFTQISYTNREWVQESPIVDSILHTSSILVGNNLVVTGNKLNGSGNADIYTIKYSANGDTLWTASYDGSSASDDYGVELASTSTGDIIVVGTAQTTTGGYDYAILKYNGTTGSLIWSYIWDGVGNGMDIPSIVKVDGTNDVYIAGGSEDSTGFSDFGVVKINAAGTLGWSSYYDYNNLHDAATDIALQNNKIVVTGVSAATAGDWDIATIRYLKSDGSQTTSSRSDIPGATLVGASAMTIDEDNNVYITGFAEISGDKNIQTIKLDSTLTVDWITNYESSEDEIANDIGVDDSGNVYISGYREYGVGKYKAVTIKYSSTGDTLWTSLYGNTITENGAQAKKLSVETDGNLYITGTSFRDTTSSYFFLKYNPEGEIVLSETYDAGNFDDSAFDIGIDDNNVYITGFSESVGSQTMRSIKYAIQERDTSIVYDDTTGLPVHTSSELIVKVDPDLVKKEEIDQLEQEWWTLEEIFDSTLVDDIEKELKVVCQEDHCPIKVYRIFKHLKTSDSLSVTRTADTIRVPKFWSTFLFDFPANVNITNASNELSGMFPDIIYSNYNLIGQTNSVPNDSLYVEQISLHTDTVGFPYPDNHINVEPAWELETGKRHIKIGVFDPNPVQWSHEDFGGEAATKVDGWDFKLDMDIYSAPLPADFNSHGTQCAGIIGAIRNNEIGVAGITGGSYATSTDLDSSGCALYGMNITFSYDEPTVDYIADAIISSSIDSDSLPYTYGLHVMSNSWGISQVDPTWFLDTNILLLREAVHFANRNQVTVVASRGNSGAVQDGGDPHDNYPAIIDDDWVICVGGTGNDGNYHDGVGAFEYGWKASRGWEIDVSAASCGSHNFKVPRPTDNYGIFSGTSAACPHAAGTAGLLMSYLNEETPDYDNLAPEDVEFILQMTATDTDVSGVDSLTGYGIVNAGDALWQVHKDKFTLAHFGTDAFPNTTNFSLYSSNDTVTLTERFENEAEDWFLPDVPYIVDTYEIKSISAHIIPSGESIIASWPRPSSSNVFDLFDGDNVLQPRERISLDSIVFNQAYMTGYIYYVEDTAGNPLGWWPIDTLTDFDLTYSILREDTTVFLNVEKNEVDNNIFVFPNPTSDYQSLILTLAQPIEGSIRLLDINGRLVKDIYQGPLNAGESRFDVDISYIPSGVYIYSILLNGEEPKHLKIIKQ